MAKQDKSAELTALRYRLIQQMPDPASILPGSVHSRMVRCNKPGCRHCQSGKNRGKGHGPIWILTFGLGKRRVRQIPIPAEWKPEVDDRLRAFAHTQQLIKQIAEVNVELLRERKLHR